MQFVSRPYTCMHVNVYANAQIYSMFFFSFKQSWDSAFFTIALKWFKVSDYINLKNSSVKLRKNEQKYKLYESRKK